MKKSMTIGFALSVGLSAFAVVPTGTEWKEPENLSFGREKRRAAFSSFDTLESALKILPEYSERTITLDSDTAWKFKWSKDPASRPVDFYKPSFDVSGWETIKVPCSWQAYGANGKGGWGTAIYVNQTYPFKRDQPDVMGEPAADWTSYLARNPVGSYRRDFEVPAKWSGQDLFLKFDAVDSFFYLWVNGEYVGFSKDSRSPAEFNVTKFVKPGKNTVALEVYRYSDGSYLEDQDMFRLSGIARSVWLLARPKMRIRDFTVTPRPVDKNNLKGDWELVITFDHQTQSFINEGKGVSAALYDFDGNKIDAVSKKDHIEDRACSLVTPDGEAVDFCFEAWKGCTLRYHSPKLWSAEEPNCYKLVLNNGKEFVSAIVGFFLSEIRDGRYWFNNEKIKLRGVNRHETDPMYGHWVPRSVHELDIRLMKEANINHIRNAHYPQDDYFYYLCNIHGIYVMDEANVESHGYYYGEASLSHRPEWQKATVARNIDMVRRNRNHPCVTMWSLGNEAGPGANFRAAAAAIKAIDTTRPLQYERDNSVVDMDSNQYPGVGWVQWKAAHHAATKPFYISEYAHNMCNAMGNLKDYQDAIESSDVILGAAIWDWVDQGLWKKMYDGKMGFAYGGDFGDKPNDGQFVFNGVVLSDRSLEPGYWEVKHVFQPFDFRFSDDGSKVTVKNLNYFRCGKGYSLVVKGVEGFKVPLTVAPRGEQTIDLPAGDAFAKTVNIVLDNDEGYLTAGHVVADAQYVDKARYADRVTFTVKGDVEAKTEGDALVFNAGETTVRFCRKSGALVSYAKGGKEKLLKPVTLDAYRAPSSNEVGLGGRWAALGLRQFDQKATSITEVTANADGSKSFTVVADVRGRQKERLIGYGGNNGKPCEIVPVGPTASFDPHFILAQKWTVFANGSVACQSEIRPRGRVVELARIGYRFTLDKRYDSVDWFGAGPFENYPDRKSGAFLGPWSSRVADLVINYGKPQDMGNMEDTCYVALRDSAEKSDEFSIVTLGDDFSFSALPYSPTELTLAMHLQALGPAEKTELGVFAAVRGLGGASCGPGPIDRDIIRSNRPFKLDFLIGCPKGLDKLPRLDDPALPPDVRTGDDIMPVVIACSSAEPGEGNAENLVDGDLGTIWHSQYGVTLTKYPHTVSVDLGRTVEAKGVSIWQRQNGANGNVKDFRFEVSADGKTWTQVLATQLKGGAAEQQFMFAAPMKVKYWRFTGLNEHGGREFASLAEISLIVSR